MHLQCLPTLLLATVLGLLLSPPSTLASQFLAPPGHRSYVLKTRTWDNSTSKNNFYVSAYHNGAGTNEVTLSPYKNSAAKGFMNGTRQQFVLDTVHTPFSFYLGGDDDWAQWQLMHINGGYGDYGGWWFDNSSTLHLNSSNFNGFLACDWWRGSPQLMWRFTISGQGLPCSCTAVKLVREDD